jgi:hypothetical protein
MTQTVPAEPELDAAALQRLARLAGLDLDTARAERLLSDVLALARADRRLAALDLGAAPASGPPWGRPVDD